MRREFGLDRPFLVQHGLFLGGTLRGDLGQSIIYRRSVVALRGERLPGHD